MFMSTGSNSSMNEIMKQIQFASQQSVNKATSGGISDEIDKLIPRTVSTIQTQASTVSSEINKASQDIANDNQIAIRQVSEKILQMRLDETMEQEIDKIISQAGGNIKDDATRNKVRSTIRGYQSVNLTQQVLISAASAQIESYLNDFISKQVSQLNNTEAIKKVRDIHLKVRDVDRILRQIDSPKEISQQLSHLMLTRLTETLDSSGRYSKFLRDFDSYAKYIGISSYDLGITLGQIEDKVAVGLEKKLGKEIKEAVKVIEQVETVIENVEKAIQKAQEQFEKLIQKYEDMAMEMIQGWEKELVSDIASKIKIDFGGIGL